MKEFLEGLNLPKQLLDKTDIYLSINFYGIYEKFFLLVLLGIIISTVSFAQIEKSEVDQNQLNIAFNDLKRYYENGIAPPYKEALNNLNSKVDTIRRNSAEYIYALCIQSLADETNGRAEWKKLPFFYETWNSNAKRIREDIAHHLGESADCSEVIRIAKWFVFNDHIKENKLEGLKVIRRIKSPESNESLDLIISNPGINEEVTVNAIEEIAARKLVNLSPKICLLQNHYRVKIRNAASSCAGILNFKLKPFKIDEAITPWIILQFNALNNLILDQVPEKAPFVKVKSEIPISMGNKWTFEYLGWIIGEDVSYFTLLDCSAQKIKIEKRFSSIRTTSLKEESQKLMRNEGIFGDRRRSGIRPHLGYEILPYFTMSAWCYNNHLKDEAATILFERINGIPSDSTFASVVRNCFGNLYYNELLYTFSQERNYQKSILLSKHLSKSAFFDFRYRSTAIQLGKQLQLRSEDFVTLALPSNKTWDSLKKSLTREGQIDYLIKRLRLLNCIQTQQPGGISYGSPQYSIPVSSFAKLIQPLDNFPHPDEEMKLESYEVINPYVELLNLKLNPQEVKLIAPYIDDPNYILAYSFFRDFQPQRVLHKVNWVVSGIILNAVGKDFVDFNSFDSLDAYSKRQEINNIIQWCDDNGNKTEEEIAKNILENTTKWSEFEKAMHKCVANEYLGVSHILIKRINDFNADKWASKSGEIAENIFKIGLTDDSDIAMIKGLENNDDKSVKFWSALCLVKSNGKYKSEGLMTLKTVLERTDGTTYARAIETLLQANNEEAFNLAETILDNQSFKQNFDWDYNSEILKRLLIAGSEKTYQFLKDGLSNFKVDPNRWSSDSKEVIYCERYIYMVSEWKNQEELHISNLSVGDQKKLSKKITEWLNDQYSLIKSGKPSDIKLINVSAPVFRLDAP